MLNDRHLSEEVFYATRGQASERVKPNFNGQLLYEVHPIPHANLYKWSLYKYMSVDRDGAAYAIIASLAGLEGTAFVFWYGNQVQFNCMLALFGEGLRARLAEIEMAEKQYTGPL
jgi:hypothetical protein